MQLSRVPNSPLSTVGTSAFRNETFIYPSQGNMNACPPSLNLIIVLIIQNKDSVEVKYKEKG